MRWITDAVSAWLAAGKLGWTQELLCFRRPRVRERKVTDDLYPSGRCSYCLGEKYQDCTNCHGRGNESCATCSGRGYIEDSEYVYDVGWQTVRRTCSNYRCTHGEQACMSCGGRGKTECKNCLQTGLSYDARNRSPVASGSTTHQAGCGLLLIGGILVFAGAAACLIMRSV